MASEEVSSGRLHAKDLKHRSPQAEIGPERGVNHTGVVVALCGDILQVQGVQGVIASCTRRMSLASHIDQRQSA